MNLPSVGWVDGWRKGGMAWLGWVTGSPPWPEDMAPGGRLRRPCFDDIMVYNALWRGTQALCAVDFFVFVVYLLDHHFLPLIKSRRGKAWRSQSLVESA